MQCIPACNEEDSASRIGADGFNCEGSTAVLSCREPVWGGALCPTNCIITITLIPTRMLTVHRGANS
jgi:hypothetical protein